MKIFLITLFTIMIAVILLFIFCAIKLAQKSDNTIYKKENQNKFQS